MVREKCRGSRFAILSAVSSFEDNKNTVRTSDLRMDEGQADKHTESK